MQFKSLKAKKYDVHFGKKLEQGVLVKNISILETINLYTGLLNQLVSN